jgi:tRNA(Ile)-lysidine synthase
VSRADLRSHLRAIGQPWVDDPSNDNDRFDRVRARKVLAALAPLGLGAGRLAVVADHLAEARHALQTATDLAWHRVVRDRGPALVLDLPALAAEPPDLQRRLAVAVIRRIAPADYAPRGAAVQALLLRVLAGKDAMLAGCRFHWHRGTLWALREAQAVAGLTARDGAPWDGQWRIDGPCPAGAEVRALGAGLALCPDCRASGLPRAVLLVAPALWLGGRLIAAPHAGFGQGYSAIPLFPTPACHEMP